MDELEKYLIELKENGFLVKILKIGVSGDCEGDRIRKRRKPCLYEPLWIYNGWALCNNHMKSNAKKDLKGGGKDD